MATFGTPCRLSSVRGHYVALMFETLHHQATFTSWLTDRSLAPRYGGVALCICSGRRPLRGRNSASAPFGLTVLVAPRVFYRLRSAPSGYFFKPSAGDYAPARLTAGFAPLRINQRKKSGFLGRGYRLPRHSSARLKVAVLGRGFRAPPPLVRRWLPL